MKSDADLHSKGKEISADLEAGEGGEGGEDVEGERMRVLGDGL